MEEKELLNKLSHFYKVLSDESRFKIVYSLLNTERCVKDIMDEVEMSQTAVSYQLKLLRNAHLVKSRKEGKNVFYSINDNHVYQIINLTIEHIEHSNEC